MKTLLLLALSWAFYYAGDLVSKFVGVPYLGWLYTAYNFLMVRSTSFQDRAGFADGSRGPWSAAVKVQDKTDEPV
jgi:hypothetical protein